MTEAAFDIAALAHQIFRRIAMADALDVLVDDRPFVERADALSSAGSVDVEMPFANAMQWASTVDGADLELGAGDVPPGNAQAPQTGSDPIGQMIALVAAGRAYDADVAALQAAKQMDVEASDIDKF